LFENALIFWMRLQNILLGLALGNRTLWKYTVLAGPVTLGNACQCSCLRQEVRVVSLKSFVRHDGGSAMNLAKAGFVALGILSFPFHVSSAPGSGTVKGRVTLSGNPPKFKSVDLSKEPECVKMHASSPLYPENVVTGPGNSLRNVVLYISAGASDNPPAPSSPALFDQQGCHYTTHVLAFRVGQEVKISNNDPFAHNIHPLAKVNREWNKMQPPGTPPFSYAYDREEFIRIKCNIHPWMDGYFVVLKTSHFAVTGEDGQFSLPDLPPGHYTVTAWHETYGTQSKEINVGADESVSLDFNFSAKP